MPVIIPNRTLLRKFLEGELELIEKSRPSEGNFLKTLLRQAVEGLVALDYGESQPMFEPDKKRGHYGTRPYTLRKLQMQALGYTDLLIEKKYKGKHAAIRTVARAYKQSANTFRSWRKRVGKTTDPLMQRYRKEVAELPWDESHILDELMKAGTKYRDQKKLAHTKKK